MDGQTDRQTDRGVCVEVRRQPWVLFFRHHPLPDFMTLLLAWNPVIRLGWPSHRALGSILLFLPSAGITSVHCSIIVSFNLCPGGQMQVTMLAWEIHHDWGGGVLCHLRVPSGEGGSWYFRNVHKVTKVSHQENLVLFVTILHPHRQPCSREI